MQKNQKPRKKAGADDDHVAVRIKRSLRRRLNTYASSLDREKQEVLDDLVDAALKEHGA